MAFLDTLILALESGEEGLVHRFRNIIRQVTNIFDHCEAQAKIKLKRLRRDINAVEDKELDIILTSLTTTGIKPLHIWGKRGWASIGAAQTRNRGCVCYDGVKKNHGGIRSAATRKHYIQIYQAMKYLSLNVPGFIEKGPQMTELARV